MFYVQSISAVILGQSCIINTELHCCSYGTWMLYQLCHIIFTAICMMSLACCSAGWGRYNNNCWFHRHGNSQPGSQWYVGTLQQWDPCHRADWRRRNSYQWKCRWGWGRGWRSWWETGPGSGEHSSQWTTLIRGHLFLTPLLSQPPLFLDSKVHTGACSLVLSQAFCKHRTNEPKP